MKKKFLYYTILTIAFNVLLAIDVIIIASFNLTSGFFMAFGAAIVLSLFSAFRSFLKRRPYFKDIKGEIESRKLNDEVPFTSVEDALLVGEQNQSLVCTEEYNQAQKEDAENKQCSTSNTSSSPTAKHKKHQYVKPSCRIPKAYFLYTLYFIATSCLWGSLYGLHKYNPQRLKNIELVQTHRYDSIAKFYIAPTAFDMYFGQTSKSDIIYNFADQRGELIIVYQGSGHKSTENEQIERWEEKTYYDYFGHKRRNVVPIYKTLYANWKYNTILSIYKLDEQIKTSKNKHKSYQYAKDKIISFLDSIGLSYSTLSSRNGIRLEYQVSSFPTIYIKSIFFANDNIYELTTSWQHLKKWKNSSLSNNVLEEMRNTHQDILDNIKDTQWRENIIDANHRILPLYVSFIILFLLIIAISIYNVLATRKAKDNRLFFYIVVLSFVNLTLLVVQYYCMYSASIIQNNNTISYLYIFATTFAFMNIPMLMFVRKKANECNNYDYLLPRLVKTYVMERCQSTMEYKSFISCEVYPLFVFGNLPFGIVVLLFWIPLGIIQVIVFELRRWIQWLFVDETIDLSCSKSCSCKFNTVVLTMILFIILVILSFYLGWVDRLIDVLGLSF